MEKESNIKNCVTKLKGISKITHISIGETKLGDSIVWFDCDKSLPSDPARNIKFTKILISLAFLLEPKEISKFKIIYVSILKTRGKRDGVEIFCSI